MTDTAGPFSSSPWAEANWYRFAPLWSPTGVSGTPAATTSAGDLPLSTSGLSVGLGAGRAWVRGGGFERTGAAVMRAVTANTHASFSRRDRIVLRRDLATHTITDVLLTGTPASTPVAPSLSQVETGAWDLPLFSFLVPPSSGTTLSGITDERIWLGTGEVLTMTTLLTYVGSLLQPNDITPAKVTRTQEGMCHLVGMMKNTASIVNATGTWATLPNGFRPPEPIIDTVYVEGGVAVAFQINPDGTIVGLGLVAGGSYPIPAPHYWSFNTTFRGA